MTVFVDSSYFVARVLARDQWRAQAIQAAEPGLRFVTSAPVINETISLLQARGQLSAALEFLQEIRANPEVEIVYLDSALQAEAWDLFCRWGGSGAGAVDCTSFAIMRRYGIKKAFTFDRHFLTAGFEILR
jgi:predicted nucleic acid-binding protein